MSLGYTEIAARAGELAGFPRDQLRSPEGVMLKGFISIHLRSIWRAAPWPEIRTVVEMTPANGSLTKTAGQDFILSISTAHPRRTTQFRRVKFWDNGTTVDLAEPLTKVWVDALAPCPDVGSLDAQALAALTISDRMAAPLLYKSAGSLLRALGKMNEGDEFLRMGEATLSEEATSFNRSPND